MRRWFIWLLIGISSIVLFPSIAGCADGVPTPARRRMSSSFPTDASQVHVDAAVHRFDAAVITSPTSVDASSTRPTDSGMRTAETCNGIDDDLDSRVDEDFLCSLGRMGEICVTSCGVNGYRLCEAPTCSWSTACHTFDEVCDDTLDNDCNGLVDDGCLTSTDSGWVCEEGMTRIHLEPNPALLGPCSRGWTLILWGAGGASESYMSTPGGSLDVTIRDDWRGWAAFTAYCGDWSGVRRWESFEGRLASEAGVTVTIDGVTGPVQVCYDPGGSIIRPMIPVECGLDDCPGRSY